MQEISSDLYYTLFEGSRIQVKLLLQRMFPEMPFPRTMRNKGEHIAKLQSSIHLDGGKLQRVHPVAVGNGPHGEITFNRMQRQVPSYHYKLKICNTMYHFQYYNDSIIVEEYHPSRSNCLHITRRRGVVF